jgi:hypothetical protein
MSTVTNSVRKNTLYPDDWPAISFEIREACGWECMACGKKCRRPGEPWDGHKRTLTVAHYDNIYDAPEVFCVALCVCCHFRHDARYSWIARRRWEHWRRRMAGQLPLALNVP